MESSILEKTREVEVSRLNELITKKYFSLSIDEAEEKDTNINESVQKIVQDRKLDIYV